MAHGLTSQLPQSSYIFRVHPWLLRAEISIQASDMRLSLKIAQKGLNEQKKILLSQLPFSGTKELLMPPKKA